MNFYEMLLEIGISKFEMEVVIRLLIASICGAFIGLEREKRGSAAGIKTFSSVALGAAMAMIANEYIMLYVSGGTGDAARMGAQVVSGIGFLGAGTIMVTGADKIKGLTTAATLWVTATIGIAIGCGFYFGAIAGTIIITIGTKIYKWIDYLLATNSKKMIICVDGDEQKFMQPLVEFFRTSDIKVCSLVRKKDRRWFEKDTCMVIEIVLPASRKHKVILEQIRDINGVLFCEEL